jgi:general secretion pathway protein D
MVKNEVINMERSKRIISIVVGLASILIIWRVGFYPHVPQPTSNEVAAAPQPAQIQRPADSNEIRTVSDANAPQREVAFDRSRRGGRMRQEDETADVGDPNDPLVVVNLNNTEMRNIIRMLTDWTGKVIIPTDEAMRVRVTIIAPERLPRSKALNLIYSALRVKGFTAKNAEDAIYIEPFENSRLAEVPVIPPEYPLAMIENKDQIVQKFFNLKNYSPAQMGQILLPLMGEYGYLSADDDSGSLLVVDTVRNLMAIALIIEQFDSAEKLVEEIFEIHHRNPSEIVDLLQTLLAQNSVAANIDSSRNTRGGMQARGGRGAAQQQGRQGQRGGPTGRNRGNLSTGGSATSVTLGTGRAQPVLVAETRNNWIIAKATAEDMETIRQWITKLDTPVPTIFSDVPLASMTNKNQVVQKFFKLQYSNPSQMSQVIEPLIGENGYISAEENTRTLLVQDTVENLIRVEGIINAFDIPESDQYVPQIFEIRNGDPSEIVQLIRLLLSEDGGTSGTSTSSRNITQSQNRNRGNRSSNNAFGGMSRTSTSSSPTTATVVGINNVPVVLIAEPKRKWIIARAPAEAMKQIEQWIDKLDQKELVEGDHESIPVKYVDATEVATRINEALVQMSDLEPSVFVTPLAQARQIMIFGNKDMREMVKKFINELDIPTGQFERETFVLKYADPDEIKTKLDELYSLTGTSSSSIYGGSRTGVSRISMGGISSALSVDTVRVISYVSLRQVTVIASAENLEQIRKQIADWDVPIDPNSLKPRIIELKNVDPVQMANLLTTLFSENSSNTRTTTTRAMLNSMYGTTATSAEKIIGPLYGQLTFSDVPGTKKIIVVSNIAEAYDVVEALVRELDKEEMAEVPTVVTLKFSDPEKLCEVLNAMFCEAGSSVEILRSATGLSTYSLDQTSSSTQTTATTNQDGYTPWWSSAGARTTTDTERPISNVIGKIRFVPETRTKSVLILSPPEFIPNIENLIAELDVPGKQVMIKAVIVEVDHQNVTSLGVQLASDSSAFGTLNENAILALNAFQQLDQHGSAIFGAAGNSGTEITNTISGNVYGLIDFLQKKVNAKILNQQSLWTEDNEEASFFKGDRVAFFTAATTGTGTSTQNFEFQRVGMNLAVRPSITPTKDVDMIINIIISQLTTDEKNGQPVRTEMETKTNMIIGDGQTLMLGGILFQQDGHTKKGVPILSDIPLVGALFSHEEKTITNNELLVFITPYVINESGENNPVTQEQIDIPKKKLEDARQDLDKTIDKMINKK